MDDLLKLHIRMSDGDHEIPARVRTGPTKVTGLLPLAREISEGITAIGIGRALAEGRSVTCRAGCAACCVQLVPIAPAEAIRLLEVVEAMPGRVRGAVKGRFESAARRLNEVGLVDRRAAPGQAALRSSPTVKTPVGGCEPPLFRRPDPLSLPGKRLLRRLSRTADGLPRIQRHDARLAVRDA